MSKVVTTKLEKTTTDFYGRAVNGYGNDVKLCMSKLLDLPIDYFTGSMCRYIETNYYSWWYYVVIGGELNWFGIEKCIHDDIIHHTCTLLIAHGDTELEKFCDENGIDY